MAGHVKGAGSGDRDGGGHSFVCPACEAPSPEHARFCSSCGEFLSSVAQAERRIVTVLFADLSGFTPLTEHLDPEEVRQLVTEVLEPLCDCVTRWGGFVDKFIGDCVMALFGAPVALENEAESALRAALDMQDAVAGRGLAVRAPAQGRGRAPGGETGRAATDQASGEARYSYDPQLSIGVNTGPVVTGVFTGGGARDYTAVGDVVNVAARLQGACEAGEILVGEETYREARHAFEFGEPEVLELKGRGEPVRARNLTGRRERRLGTRGFQGRQVPLVGRQEELDALRNLWGRAAAGRFQRSVLVGPPGIGKTRLVEALAESEGLDPGHLVRGRSYPYAAATPWETVTEMLRRLFGLSPQLSSEEAVSAVISHDTRFWTPQERAALAIAFGGEAERTGELGSVDAAERRQRVVDAAVRAVEAGVRSGPRLLVAEDLHWADRASLHFFQALEGRMPDQPALAILVTRPPLPPQQRLAELLEAATSTVELLPLSAEESRQLVEAALGRHELPEALMEELVAHAGGNPLFIEEALKTLQQDGVISEEEGVWRAAVEGVDLEIPDSVESVLSSRIDGLHAPTKRVLQFASIVGRRFWSGVLADALAGRPVEQELAELSRGEFVRRHEESLIEGEREFAFQHLLLQEVAYEGLLHTSRRELHGDVARWLEARLPEGDPEYAEWLAYHYERSNRPVRAASHLERAARSARDRGALEDAASLARRAREAAGEEAPTARSALCLLDEIAAALGDDELRKEAIDELAAVAGGDPESEAEAVYRRTRYLLSAGRLEEAEEVGREALSRYRELDELSREADTLVQLGRVAHLGGDYPTAMERYGSSLPLQRQAGDRNGEAEVLDRLGLVEVDWGRFVEARERFDAAERIYRELGDRAAAARVRAHSATALRWLGCLVTAEEEARAALEVAGASGSRRARASAALTLATVLGEEGRVEEAETLLEEVLEFATEGGRPGTAARAWLVRANLGSGPAGREHATRAVAAARESGVVHMELLALAREAELALADGDLETADESSERALAGLRRQGHVQGPEERILWTRARVLRTAGRGEEADALAEEARETVREKAAWIEEPELRERFLREIPLNAEILGRASPVMQADGAGESETTPAEE